MLKMNSKEFDREITDTQLLNNEHDFYKLYAMLCSLTGGDEERMFFSIGCRILLHEYLALVLSGKISPYELGFADKEDKERFKVCMARYTEVLQEMGVPFKEEDNGVMSFDYDEITRRANGEA